MKVVIGIVIIAIIALVVGCATPSEPVPDKSGIVETQSRQTESPSYEVVRTYTDEVIVGTKPGGPPGGSMVDLRPRASVEIKNTGNLAGLFSVYIFFSEEYSGRELLYLKPGETGVATYTPFQTFEEWKTQGLRDFKDKTAEWDYKVTPVVLNP